jgi:23S rRNA (cytidine1920-2'-O)/16S rRNA (cytidine1409-2'-O)-methyltransferase
LRKDPRVTLFERTNIRLVDPKHLPFVPDGAVADMSFISLKLVLPRLKVLVKAGGPLITLVKPQFEVGRSEVGKGVVRDIGKIRGAIDAVKSFARSIELHVNGEMESPIRGPKGNREFFLHLTTPRE